MCPEKIIIKNDDGSEVEKEYFTAEDLKSIEDEKEKIKQEYEEKLQDVEKDLNPNFKELRAVAKSWEQKAKALEAQGKTINEEGQVIDLAPKPISIEEVEARARKMVREEQVNLEKEKFFSQYDDETKKVVEHNFNKLTAGEDISISNISKFMDQAEMLSIPSAGNRISKALSYGRGSAPIREKQDDFAETDSGKELSQAMGLRNINNK